MGWYLADVMVKFCFVFCRFAGGLARRRESTAPHCTCVGASYCCCAGRRPLVSYQEIVFVFIVVVSCEQEVCV
jgi:hypothetical protein